MHYFNQAQAAPPTVGASTVQQPPPPDGGFSIIQFFPIALIIIVFYFLIIRPQQKGQRERDGLLKNLKKNDHVFTSGGIAGVVTTIKDGEVILLIDEKHDIRVRVMRSAIVGVEKASPAEEKPEQQKEETKK